MFHANENLGTNLNAINWLPPLHWLKYELAELWWALVQNLCHIWKLPIIMKMEIGLMVRPGLVGLCGIPVLPSHCIHTHSFLDFICNWYFLHERDNLSPQGAFLSANAPTHRRVPRNWELWALENFMNLFFSFHNCTLNANLLCTKTILWKLLIYLMV